MLQSLLKSATGTGMVENASYNRGDPFFIAFRPLLHEHAALPDDMLENYNKYNKLLDDIEFQIEQLKENDVDTFDISFRIQNGIRQSKVCKFQYG